MKETETAKKNLNKSHKSNRTLVAACICSVIFMLFVTLGSVIFFRMQIHKSVELMENTEEKTYDSYYVMIPSNNSSSFWESVYESARQYGENNNCLVEMFGKNLSTGYSQNELLKMAIASDVDGIIFEADETGMSMKLINEASEKGIPVVTVLGDCSASERKSFVGISNYNLGREYGKQVLKIKNRKIKNVLVLMNANAKDSSQNIIFSGIQEAVEEENWTVEDKLIVRAKAIDNRGIFAAEESIRDIFMNQGELPDVIVCLDELCTTCTYQAVVDYNKVGNIDIIGFHDSETILKGIERDVIRSTIAVDTKEMGEYCVEALNEYKETGHVSDYYSVNTNLITAENVKEYLGGDQDDDK